MVEAASGSSIKLYKLLIPVHLLLGFGLYLAASFLQINSTVAKHKRKAVRRNARIEGWGGGKSLSLYRNPCNPSIVSNGILWLI